MIDIPAGICAAVHAGEMPLPIFADWLEDHDWPQAARGCRMLDNLGVEIRHLKVKRPLLGGEGDPLAVDYWIGRDYSWTLHRTPADVPLLCATLAFGELAFPLDYAGYLEGKFHPYHKYRCKDGAKLKCQVCNRGRDTNPIRVCRQCFRANKKLDTIIIPDIFQCDDLLRERKERAALATRKSVEKRKSP